MNKIIKEAEKFRKIYGLKGFPSFNELKRIAKLNDWELRTYSQADALIKNHKL